MKKLTLYTTKTALARKLNHTPHTILAMLRRGDVIEVEVENNNGAKSSAYVRKIDLVDYAESI